jgi:hypothetical protein
LDIAKKNNLDVDFINLNMNISNLPLSWLIENSNSMNINFIDFEGQNTERVKKYIDSNYYLYHSNIKTKREDIIDVYTGIMKDILDIYETYNSPEKCIMNLVNKIRTYEFKKYKNKNKLIIVFNIPPRHYMKIKVFIEKIHFMKFNSVIEINNYISADVINSYMDIMTYLNNYLIKSYFMLAGAYSEFLVITAPYLIDNKEKTFFIESCDSDNFFLEYFKELSNRKDSYLNISWYWKKRNYVLKINSLYSKRFI